MRLSIVPAQWPGDTVVEIAKVTRLASASGLTAAWYSEVNGYDGVALAAAMASAGHTGKMGIVVGPIPVTVRNPAQLAMGLATVQGFTEGEVGVALGASTPTIVEEWHGGDASRPLADMEAYVPALRSIATGERSAHSGPGWSSHGFKLMVPPLRRLEISVAALGERMLGLAGAIADRVVVNLVPPSLLPRLTETVAAAAESRGRRMPAMVSWLMAGTKDHALGRASRLLTAYFTAPGYSDRLRQSGVSSETPEEAANHLGAFSRGALVEKLEMYSQAGADEVALVVSGADPGAADLLEAAVTM